MSTIIQPSAAPVQDTLGALIQDLYALNGLDLKRDIAAVSTHLPMLPDSWHPNGDDAAAIPLPDGSWQLLAIEGMQPGLVAEQPWFAGWCSVLVNCSDIAAMGGRAIALVDALWSRGEGDHIAQVVAGMNAACEHLGVPIVGGHTNAQAKQENLAVAILGQANTLLSSFAGKPGHKVVVAMDQRGAFHGDSLNWNAASTAPSERLRQDLALLPQVAEQGLALACKDISQAGLLGSLTMLLESSACGAQVNIDDIPKPDGVAWCDWLAAFPSFGYVFTTPAHQAQGLVGLFESRDIHAAMIGEIDASKHLLLSMAGQQQVFYDLNRQGLTGF